jgi:hypothetical protein
MPGSILITDDHTVGLVERLVSVVGFPSKTAAVNAAARAMLLSRGIDVDRENAPKTTAEAALIERLGAELKDVTRTYVRLLEKATGKPSGSRMYQMLKRRGPVDTVRRIVAQPSAGLDFLAKCDPPRLDLAFETIALKHDYRTLFEDQTLRQAELNLHEARRRASGPE